MDKPIKNHISSDVIAVQQVVEIPLILDTIAMMTGLSFLCVARVKPSSLTVCAVLDNASNGLKPGDTLNINSAIYEALSSIKKVIAVDDVGEDQEYSPLPLPGLSAFESFISSPIILENGKFFGNLYGVGSAAITLLNNTLTGSIAMLTKIISSRLSDHLISEAVKFLTCDSRHPVNIIPHAFKNESNNLEVNLPTVIQEIDSNHVAIDPLWGRMDFDSKFNLSLQGNIKAALMHVIEGLCHMYPNRAIVADIDPNVVLKCDIEKLGQLLSNLLNNALIFGHPNHAVRVNVECQDRLFRLTVT